VIEDVTRALTIAPGEGDTLVLLGAALAQPAETLAGSEYLARMHGKVAGRPRIDLDLEARVQRLVLDAHERGLLTAAHDCADGGLAVAIAECCIAADAGLDAPLAALGPRLDAALFGEAQSRFLVAVPDTGALATLRSLAADAHVPIEVLGAVSGDRVRLGAVDVSLAALASAHEGGLERILGAVGADPDVARRA